MTCELHLVQSPQLRGISVHIVSRRESGIAYPRHSSNCERYLHRLCKSADWITLPLTNSVFYRTRLICFADVFTAKVK